MTHIVFNRQYLQYVKKLKLLAGISKYWIVSKCNLQSVSQSAAYLNNYLLNSILVYIYMNVNQCSENIHILKCKIKITTEM